MALQDEIQNDIKKALKEGEQVKRSVLSMLLSSLHNTAIEKGKQDELLSDEEVLEVIAAEAKKRKDAIVSFLEGERKDLAEKEKQELALLEEYLPEQLSAEEIEKVVQEVIEQVNATSMGDIGAVMGKAMQRLKGKADGTAVREAVERILGGN